MRIEACLSPLFMSESIDLSSKVVVVVDVFRASTTICTALANGALSVTPIEQLEDALALKRNGYLVGAERNALRCEGAHFGNSPFEYQAEMVQARRIALTTTNGTRAINLAKNCYSLVVGAFVNIDSVARYCLAMHKDVIIVCAGWNNQVSMEDTLFAGALIHQLSQNGFEVISDSSLIAHSLWHNAESDLFAFLSPSEHFNRLLNHGLAEDLKFCLALNQYSVLPVLANSGELVIGNVHLS